MKKIYFQAALLSLVVSLTACGGGNDATSTGTGVTSTSAVVAPNVGNVTSTTSNTPPSSVKPSTAVAVVPPAGVVSAATQKFAYVTDSSGIVSMFSVSGNGYLDPINPPNTSGQYAVAVVVNSAGTNAYAANNSSISLYSINGSTGVLTDLMGGAAYSAQGVSDLRGIAIHPSGNYLYATGYDAGNIAQFNVQNGKWECLSPCQVVAGTNPYGIAINPAGTYAYVTNSGNNTVSMYSISSSGTLTPLSTPTVGSGPSPQAIVIDSAGTYAYVAHYASNSIGIYSIGSDGILSNLRYVTTSANPTSIAITK